MPTPDGLLLTITGPERPDLVRRLTKTLTEGAVSLLDVFQSTWAGRSQVFLHIGVEASDHPVIASLKSVCADLGLQVHVAEAMAPDVIKPRWVVTVIHRDPQRLSGIVGTVTAAVDHRGFGVDGIRRLSKDPRHVLEVALTERGDAHANADGLREDFRAFTEDPADGLDLVLQREVPTRRLKRLVVFDMDSTLIQQEVIDELARAAGAYDRVAAITAQAMNGELSFEASLRARVMALQGVSVDVFEQVRARLTLTDGARELIHVLKQLGYRAAVISGGFIQVVQPVADEIGLDYAFANELEVRDGVLTGGLVGQIVDRAHKARLVEALADRERIGLDQILAIGDGANDLDMLGRAGLGVAFNAKPRVRAAAEHSLNQPRLDAVLYLLGLDDHAIQDIELTQDLRPVMP